MAMAAFLVPNCAGLTRHISLPRHRLDIDKDLPELERAAGMTFFKIVDRSRIAKPRSLHGSEEHLRSDAEHKTQIPI